MTLIGSIGELVFLKNCLAILDSCTVSKHHTPDGVDYIKGHASPRSSVSQTSFVHTQTYSYRQKPASPTE